MVDASEFVFGTGKWKKRRRKKMPQNERDFFCHSFVPLGERALMLFSSSLDTNNEHPLGPSALWFRTFVKAQIPWTIWRTITQNEKTRPKKFLHYFSAVQIAVEIV